MNNLNGIRNLALTFIFQGRLSETYQPNAKGIPFPASRRMKNLRNRKNFSSEEWNWFWQGHPDQSRTLTAPWNQSGFQGEGKLKNQVSDRISYCFISQVDFSSHFTASVILVRKLSQTLHPGWNSAAARILFFCLFLVKFLEGGKNFFVVWWTVFRIPDDSLLIYDYRAPVKEELIGADHPVLIAQISGDIRK